MTTHPLHHTLQALRLKAHSIYQRGGMLAEGYFMALDDIAAIPAESCTPVTLGLGTVALAGCVGLATNLPGLALMPIAGPARALGEDCSDLLPYGASTDGALALLYFQSPEAVTNLIEALEEVRDTLFVTPSPVGWAEEGALP